MSTGPGTVLAGRYQLDKRVGGGAMGEVWRSTDTALDRTVAVKVVRQELLDQPGFRERFLSEARTMAKIKHRGVVAVHDYFSDDEVAFLVMEYVEGESLSHRLHRLGRMAAGQTMTLVAEAADALQAAHDKGVVHRDVKPGNLLVASDGAVVLTDFGIARSMASAPLTATGAVVGTVAYLAPEQVLGKPATSRSDVYALGVVAYECLTGRRPFDGDNPFEIAMKRLREPAPTMAGDMPPAVLAVVDRAMAADPERRWESAADLAVAARRSSAAVSAGRAQVLTPPPLPTSGPPRSPGPATPHPSHPPGPGTPRPPGPPTPHPPPTSPAHSMPPPPPLGARPMATTPGYPPPGYGPPGYHTAPPPHRPGPLPGPSTQNTLGILGLVFGILGVVISCCWFLGFPLGAAGLVLGGLGMKKASDGLAGGRALALWGMITGGAAVVLSIFFFSLFLFADYSTY